MLIRQKSFLLLILGPAHVHIPPLKIHLPIFLMVKYSWIAIYAKELA